MMNKKKIENWYKRETIKVGNAGKKWYDIDSDVSYEYAEWNAIMIMPSKGRSLDPKFRVGLNPFSRICASVYTHVERHTYMYKVKHMHVHRCTYFLVRIVHTKP